MSTLSNILLFAITIILVYSCNTTEPPPPPDETKPTLTLALEDISCTEAWLQLTTKDLELPAQLTLKQYNPTGDSLSQIFLLNTQDSLLYVDSLLPNQTYSFRVSSIENPVSPEGTSSNKLPVITMDTTSHNFTWQTFEFGQHSSSILYDVAIIDENNIWAVGEIYMNDSLGIPDPTFYNAAHWDGNNWELKRILYKGSIWSIKTIYAFSSSDIWFSAFVRYYNGQFIELPIPNILMGWSKNRIWGSSSNDLYVVGNNGNIAHFTSTQFVNTWTKLESGTTLNLTGIYKSPNSDVIWISGRSGTYSHSVLLRCKNNVCEKVYEGPSTDFFNGNEIGFFPNVWSDNKYRTYLNNGFGLYVQDNDKEFSFKRLTPIFSDVAFGMSGEKSNNIFVAGQKGFVGHYNGYTYKEYPELLNNSVYFNAVSVKGGKASIVGFKLGSFSSKAIIYLFNN